MISKLFIKVFILTLLSLSFACTSINVVNVKDAAEVEIKDNGVIYALPKTVIRVEVEATKTETIAGEFSQYADKYLGLSGVMQNSISWEISNISISEHSIPDANHYYYVESSNSKRPTLINLTDNGILSSINKDSKHNKIKPFFSHTKDISPYSGLSKGIVIDGQKEKIDTTYRTIRTDSTVRRIPVYKKHLVDKSAEDKAKDIAKYILTLRDEKMNLMIGDVEEFPDGIATSKIIDEFNKMEQEYLSLFIGSQSSSTEKMIFEITPDKNNKLDNTLFYFSPKTGLSDKPIADVGKVSINFEDEMNTQFLDSFLNHKDTLVTKDKGLFYRVPENVKLNIMYENTILASKNIVIPQFGKINILPSKYLCKRRIAIEFNHETGGLKSILKK